ncbi:hypothetical protein CD58_16015 [Pseudomonas brassicacearum]|nr:hypothetical protein CD58_16015 [Pseudomonas brassicacearum]
MIQSAIAYMAADAIADGTLNLYSTEHNEATFKLLLSQGNTSPGEALPPERTAGIGASRPKRNSLDSLALTDISLETVNQPSDTRLSRVEPGEPDNPAIKAGAEAYQALSPKTRAALDAILELVDKHGEAALSDISKEARHSLDEYRDLSYRFSFVDADGGESNDWTSNPVPTP